MVYVKIAERIQNFNLQTTCYPGDGASHLPELTQMEEMLIFPVHALVQLWQICWWSNQIHWSYLQFPHENAIFHAKVPLLPERM